MNFVAPLAAAVLAATPAWPDLAQPAEAGDGAGDAAVIVGLERYGSVPGVPGAVRNANDWYAFLTRGRKVPTASIALLRNEEATLERLKKQASEAARRVKKDGTLWFVFIGHGAPAEDGKDGILVGFDAQQAADSLFARSLPQKELLALLEKGEQARTVAVIDACFSGRTGSGEELVRGLQPLLPVAAAGKLPRKTSVLTAARGDQLAGALPQTGRPAFSYLVLGALRGWGDRDGDRHVSAAEAVAYAEEALRTVVTDRVQTPGLTGDDLLLSDGIEAGPDLAAIRLAAVAPSPAAPAVVGAPAQVPAAVAEGSPFQLFTAEATLGYAFYRGKAYRQVTGPAPAASGFVGVYSGEVSGSYPRFGTDLSFFPLGSGERRGLRGLGLVGDLRVGFGDGKSVPTGAVADGGTSGDLGETSFGVDVVYRWAFGGSAAAPMLGGRAGYGVVLLRDGLSLTPATAMPSHFVPELASVRVGIDAAFPELLLGSGLTGGFAWYTGTNDTTKFAETVETGLRASLGVGNPGAGAGQLTWRLGCELLRVTDRNAVIVLAGEPTTDSEEMSAWVVVLGGALGYAF